MVTDLEQRIEKIEQRNKRVELDKAWEVSITRRISIATLTYAVVFCYLTFIHNDNPFINAFVPPAGYLLSTLVMRRIRDYWQKTSKK